MKQEYVEPNFRPASMAMITKCNGIIDDFVQQGFRLTVRQLYYQLVAAGLIENTIQSYKRITSLVNDARMAGLLDWDAIEDRTRDFVRRQRWENGSQILKAASDSFHIDMWANQECRPFVIVEKEALVGVLQGVCNDLDVPLLAARGYPSSTVLREFVERDIEESQGQVLQIFHLGDHDPSGIDMSRDLEERLNMFSEYMGIKIHLDRIALNYAQIEELSPPPNPAKDTDSRFASYRRKFGEKSWELDAIPPTQLAALARGFIDRVRDPVAWAEKVEAREDVQARLAKLAKTFKEND
jgi:hypothetical protein